MKTILAEDVFFEMCHFTNQPLNEGFCIEHLGIYIVESKQGEALLLNYAKELGFEYKSLEDAYNDEFYFYTVWDCNYQIEEDVLYFYDSKGVLYDRENSNEPFINNETKEKFVLVFD